MVKSEVLYMRLNFKFNGVTLVCGKLSLTISKSYPNYRRAFKRSKVGSYNFYHWKWIEAVYPNKA